MSLQEKFQITVPGKDDDKDHKWSCFDSARKVNDLPKGSVISKADDTNHQKFNYPSPGMEVDNQERARINNMPVSVSGQTDVSKDTNPESFANGFTRCEMKGSDDQYTGEHMDHFYGEVKDELGNAGFAERNNYMDRE